MKGFASILDTINEKYRHFIQKLNLRGGYFFDDLFQQFKRFIFSKKNNLLFDLII